MTRVIVPSANRGGKRLLAELDKYMRMYLQSEFIAIGEMSTKVATRQREVLEELNEARKFFGLPLISFDEAEGLEDD